MRVVTDSPLPHVEMPARVRLALVMLWTAWVISLYALIAHLYPTGRFSADLYSIIGPPAALIQALLIYFVGKRSNIARIIVLSIAIPAFVVAAMFFSAFIAPLRFGVEAALRASAVILLLTPRSAHWFKQIRLTERALPIAETDRES